MTTNSLDYLYEGYGYDMDNQLLYMHSDTYKTVLDENGMSDQGMKTISAIGYRDRIPTEKANKYKEIGQFISENGANYTDLRQQICKCCDKQA